MKLIYDLEVPVAMFIAATLIVWCVWRLLSAEIAEGLILLIAGVTSAILLLSALANRLDKRK